MIRCGLLLLLWVLPWACLNAQYEEDPTPQPNVNQNDGYLSFGGAVEFIRGDLATSRIPYYMSEIGFEVPIGKNLFSKLGVEANWTKVVNPSIFCNRNPQLCPICPVGLSCSPLTPNGLPLEIDPTRVFKDTWVFAPSAIFGYQYDNFSPFVGLSGGVRFNRGQEFSSNDDLKLKSSTNYGYSLSATLGVLYRISDRFRLNTQYRVRDHKMNNFKVSEVAKSNPAVQWYEGGKIRTNTFQVGLDILF